ncbi:hypothetical protein EIN_335540 [Entamoeba invadens IP1]|uniref:CCHC-type domain-containing protein n=1 Tax=Entamoeba invadens IP1 TaxID=370355 RepID=L7FLH9_ENTIV|nr:hypothetical protein EIN_335540 [Entamoeba invadens IP1]ELP88572.1 hypothetical protein EIN_335540 [Entamoeba invadens IP1]|eukprot:XP_004255343.1 hypothetical protein EIN_335540 [Entamoeba invadens IP1]
MDGKKECKCQCACGAAPGEKKEKVKQCYLCKETGHTFKDCKFKDDAEKVNVPLEAHEDAKNGEIREDHSDEDIIGNNGEENVEIEEEKEAKSEEEIDEEDEDEFEEGSEEKKEQSNEQEGSDEEDDD